MAEEAGAAPPPAAPSAAPEDAAGGGDSATVPGVAGAGDAAEAVVCVSEVAATGQEAGDEDGKDLKDCKDKDSRDRDFRDKDSKDKDVRDKDFKDKDSKQDKESKDKDCKHDKESKDKDGKEKESKDKDKDYKYRKLLYLFKFSKSTKKSKKEEAKLARNTLGTPEERRSQLDRDMKSSWDTLPETLRKKKQRVSRALLSEFIVDGSEEGRTPAPPGPEDPVSKEGAGGGDVAGGSGGSPKDALLRSGVYYDDDEDDEDEDTKSSTSSSCSEKNEVCVYQVQPARAGSASSAVEVVTRAMFHRQDEETSLVADGGAEQTETQIGEEEIYQKMSFETDSTSERLSTVILDDGEKEEEEIEVEGGTMISLTKTEDESVEPAVSDGTASPAPAPSAPSSPRPPSSPTSASPPSASPHSASPPSGQCPEPSPPQSPTTPGPTQPPRPPSPPTVDSNSKKIPDVDPDSGVEAKGSCSSPLEDSNTTVFGFECGADTEYATVVLSTRSCEESDATTVAADESVSLYSRPRPAKTSVAAANQGAGDARAPGLDSEALAAVEMLARAVSSDSLLGGSSGSSGSSGSNSGPQCSPANSQSSLLDNMKLHEDDSGTDVNNPSSSSSSSAASSCAGDVVAAVVECGEYEDVSPVHPEPKAEPKVDAKAEAKTEHVYEAMQPTVSALYSSVGKASKAGKPPAPGAQPLPGMHLGDPKSPKDSSTPQYLLEALSKRAAAKDSKQDEEHYTFMELSPGDAKAKGSGLYVKKSQQTAASAVSGRAAGGAAPASQKLPPHLTAPIFYNPLVQCPPAAPETAAPAAATTSPPLSPSRDDLRPGNKKPCPVFKPHGFEPLAGHGASTASDSEHLTDSFDEDEAVSPSGRPGLAEEPLWRRPDPAPAAGAGLCSWRPQLEPLLCRRSVTMETIVEEPNTHSATAAAGQDDSRLTVREILRRFEELGGKVPSLCDADPRDADGDPDDEESEEKSATLREIQETLMNLEEKVRNYQCKMASSGPSSLQLQPSPQPHQQPPLQQQPPPQQQSPVKHHHHHHHHHHSRQQQLAALAV
ncbi:hypothetical protein ONE63_008007 [Megalurothrips usitatus]|uniref:Uncharacterized protein n=1 Tax=Megalurothrips usitatus TaxID=439358 RepID=A0AAV7XUD0_9NEOP|nr:hypothetical protein ONE63_008007 [Megalurothrips usitatus]